VAQLALTLAKELWMMRDRQMVLEHVLSAGDADIRAKIEHFQPDPAFAARLEGERLRIVREVIASLQAPGDR